MVSICNLAIFSTNDAKLVQFILISKNNKLKPKVIITNNPDSPVIEVAKRHNINYKIFDHREYNDRVSHEKDIVRFLLMEKINLIIFAHYSRLVTKYFVDKFRNKIINVHPSLLPNFKGANGYKDAFEAGVEKSGCTLHYVDEGLDTGKIILQNEVSRLANDKFNLFKERVHNIECEAVQTLVEYMVY